MGERSGGGGRRKDPLDIEWKAGGWWTVWKLGGGVRGEGGGEEVLSRTIAGWRERLAQVCGWDDVRGRCAERLFHVIGSIPGFDPCHWVGLPAQQRVCFVSCPLLGSFVGAMTLGLPCHWVPLRRVCIYIHPDARAHARAHALACTHTHGRTHAHIHIHTHTDRNVRGEVQVGKDSQICLPSFRCHGMCH